jgi:uracil-DNA glycosylase, family 4
MSLGHSAIYQELQRLKAEGIEHVFLDDETKAILAAAVSAQGAREETPNRPVKSTGIDLRAAVAEFSGNARPSPSRPAPAKAKLNNLPDTYIPIPEQPPEFTIPDGSPVEQLSALEKQVLNCKVCNEHLSERGKIVFGVGSAEADIMFCGEAPGADEEIQGEPFVGKAGELLTKIIMAMGIKRDSVYIANILKWRPEHDKPYGNRPPTPEEMNFCLPYLKAQIEIIRPKVVVALGNTAVSGLLGPDPSRRMGSIRGTWQDFQDIPMMVTFHPSYLLRNDTMKTKRMVWEDMLQVMERAGLPINEKQRGYFLPKQ